MYKEGTTSFCIVPMLIIFLEKGCNRGSVVAVIGSMTAVSPPVVAWSTEAPNLDEKLEMGQ